jgi:hypothetical protein
MKEKFSLKDELFNQQKVEKLANETAKVYPIFKHSEFTKVVLEKFPLLELKVSSKPSKRYSQNRCSIGYKNSKTVESLL